MKFNVQVEIDYMKEDGSLDSEVQEQIINGLTDQIFIELSKGVGAKIAQTAEGLVRAKTEMVINTAIEAPVTITEGWNSKKEYSSIYSMVEEKMTKLYEGKLGSNGKCEKDPLLANIENYVDKKVKTLLITVEKKVKEISSQKATKAINEHELIKAIGLVVKDGKP